LKVTGLSAERYALTIDDQEAGTFSKDELAMGVNLAMLPTPMARQSLEVHAFTLKHNNIHAARWRQLQVPLEKDALDRVRPAMAALDELEQELILRQRAAAQPQARHFKLIAR